MLLWNLNVDNLIIFYHIQGKGKELSVPPLESCTSYEAHTDRTFIMFIFDKYISEQNKLWNISGW